MTWPWLLLAALAAFVGAAALGRGLERTRTRCTFHVRPPDNGLGYPAWPRPARCEKPYAHDGLCRVHSTDGKWVVYFDPTRPWDSSVRRDIKDLL